MCESYKDLIDLSNEDSNEGIRTSTNLPTSKLDGESERPSLTTIAERESLDNNPFDFAQKLANRPQDPFEIVAREASAKARYSMRSTHEVEIGDLLSLSDDNILDKKDPTACEKIRCAEKISRNSVETTTLNDNSTFYHTAIIQDLESESPPVSMSIKSTPDTCSSTVESDESSANSADGFVSKSRKALESRKRLLKLSIANSTFNSPLSCRSRQCESEFSTVFTAAINSNDHMLATESPLKLVEDDFMTRDPPKLANAEQDFEADLRMLSIPMLEKLPSPLHQEVSVVSKKENEGVEQTQYMITPNLANLRERLRAKQMNCVKDKNVEILIDNLKSLMCNNNIVEENRKEKANSLLQQLSSALNAENTDFEDIERKVEGIVNIESSTKKPQSIVRQSTFDMELKASENENCLSSDVPLHVSQSPQSLSPAKEMPESMLKSSATYDSEPVSDRENLLLPHVETISPITSPNTKASVLNEEMTSHFDLNDIIEQISKLVEQQQIGSNSHGASVNEHSNASQAPSICNPTFIVVMPTNNVQSNTNKQNVSSAYSECFGDINSFSAMRRRSQSLSLHDKVKIVQLPIRPQEHVTEVEDSPPNRIMSQNNTATLENKTPMRALRRNSFSLGIPHTPLTTLNQRTGATNARRFANLPSQSRYSIGPSKIQEHETQHQAVVHPIPRASNWNSFKPDLRKKSKQQTTKTSVMTSKAPLKAVMPINKLAPTLIATMATPEKPVFNARLQAHKSSMETSIQLLTASGKIPHTSTPTSVARNTAPINEVPNACSTPALTNFAPRASGAVNKKNSRFLNSTPASKESYTSCSSGLKKRPLPELAKAKSPVRMRNSLTGMTGRPSMKLQNIAKQSESRLSVRSNMRPSFGGSTSTNKENKKP